MDQQKTPLQKLRAARGYTQTEVATAVGMDQATYHNIETTGAAGKHNAAKLVDFFGRDVIHELMVLFPERYPNYKVPTHA